MPRGDAIPTSVAVDLLDRALAAVPAFLFGGTLLGAVRGGRILDDDWDVDLALLVEDWRPEYVAELAANGLHVATERRWGRQTPWASGFYVDALLASPSLFRLERDDGHHIDLHILARGLDPTWAYWQRGPTDELLMRTPIVLLEGRAPAVLEGRVVDVPAHADALLTYCYGDWRQRVPAVEWYGSTEYERVWQQRAVQHRGGVD